MSEKIFLKNHNENRSHSAKLSKSKPSRRWRFWSKLIVEGKINPFHKGPSINYVVSRGGGALCVQMDFMRTFEANTKCNSNKYVWSYFYQILVVLKYHRRLWNNIFDTNIFRCINNNIKVTYLAFFGISMLLELSLSKILIHGRLWY